MYRQLVALLGLPVLLAIAPAHGQGGKPNTGLPTTKLTIGPATITAEIAATHEHRQTGLMHRFSLAPDSGMLFVFAAPQRLSFWMRNTHIPLSIAFIDAQGTIVGIEDMAPLDERSTWSTVPALYALEMRKGWFAQKGIGPGTRVVGLPGKAPE
ncbi:MAG TPA: DUF192 domain-containing protein [Casimicrobiaceae bacterium]|nr:DUF192 domain-containing protein [Casimicrobiaceae bacterium]